MLSLYFLFSFIKAPLYIGPISTSIYLNICIWYNCPVYYIYKYLQINCCRCSNRRFCISSLRKSAIQETTTTTTTTTGTRNCPSIILEAYGKNYFHS